MASALCVVVNVADDYDVYIGRNPRYGDTYWGNPFVVGVDGTREQCIAKYKRMLLRDKERMQSLRELRGKRIACHCKSSETSSAPDKACHGDVIADLVNNLDKRSLFRRRT